MSNAYHTSFFRLSRTSVLLLVFAFKMAICRVAVAEEVSATDWPSVEPGYQVQLPRDHAPHPRFRIEWWYFTGNLKASSGERFGYQLTFFRIGVNSKADNPSAWALENIFASHFAITSVDLGPTYWSDERLSRGSLGLAGGDEERVWLEGDEVRFRNPGFSLRADRGDQAISLELAPTKPVVLHGDSGFSRKGETPGNASYYYSFTRLITKGELRWHNKKFQVDGESWMDHEWGSSFLEKGSQGWDWFSLQLSNGRELMLFQIRDDLGQRVRFSSGTMVESDGRTTKLLAKDISLRPLRSWRSPSSKGNYPVEWKVVVPGLDLLVMANLDSQEFVSGERGLGVSYWEGSVRVQGENLSGIGYLEMTGYAESRNLSKALSVK